MNPLSYILSPALGEGLPKWTLAGEGALSLVLKFAKLTNNLLPDLGLGSLGEVNAILSLQSVNCASLERFVRTEIASVLHASLLIILLMDSS